MSASLAIAQILLSTLLVAVTLIWGIRRYRRSNRHRRSTFKVQAYLLWCLSGCIALSSFVPMAYLYTEHLWFESVGYADVFWKLQKTRWGIFGACFIVAVGFMNVNAAIANILCPESREFSRWTHTRTFSFHRTVFCIIFFAALILATPMLLLDDTFLRYQNRPVAENGQPMAQLESETAAAESTPIRSEGGEGAAKVVGAAEATHLFGKHRYFYLFTFPLYRWLSLWIEIMLWTTCVIVGLLYNFYYRRDAHTMARVKRHIIFHGSILWLMLLAAGFWRAYVNLWSKVYTSPLSDSLAAFHGLFYVDAKLAGATHLYSGVLIGVGIAVLINLFWRKRLVWYLTVGIWGASYLLLIHAYPIAVHWLEVRQYTFAQEETYLERHIEDTRRAFELDTIAELDRVKGLATLDMVERNAEVKDNVQLWDRRVLYEALRDGQIEPHFNFHPYTDVDRYLVNGEYRQVLIAAREIDPDDITDWERRKLVFTRGYGVCVAPVNEFVENGLPNFWVKGTPVTSEYPELTVERPHIYYGEMTHEYAIVNTQHTEHDPPDVPTHEYNGEGGVPLGGWFRRLCFSVRFDFLPILRSKHLTPESRVMFWRKIGTRRAKKLVADRVSHIAPFLNYDPDPYVVINKGELWWIIDFYVTSRYYPNAQIYTDDMTELIAREQYAEPHFKRFNYIRNSGVAVVNAYTGAVNFYAIKADEEITRTYQQAFPNLFKPIAQMPEGLKAHLRYPDYLTRIQAKMYGDYHQETADFFNKGKRWHIPKEAYYSERADQEMMPYYAMLKLPQEESVEFVNMIPFTPPKKVNLMKAWLVARCDAANYGQRIAYILPEQESVIGPTQVEEDINKAFSDRFLGWKTANDVIRGNLLIIPIEDSLFYIEAIYLQPKRTEDTDPDDTKQSRPRLAVVVVKADASELAAAATFELALEQIFLGQKVGAQPTSAEGEAPPTLWELVEKGMTAAEESRQIFQEVLDALKATEQQK